MAASRTSSVRGRISARVRFPSFRVDVDSEDPLRTLQELTKALHALKSVEMVREVDCAQDDPIVWRLGYISDELRDNPELMEFIAQAMRIEESAQHKRIAIDNQRIVDFNTSKCSSTLPIDGVRSRLTDLCKGHEDSAAAVVHVVGDISDDEKSAIVDIVRQRLPKATLRTLFTRREHLGKTLVEMVFFGPFREEEPRQ